jgi:diacylglycerol kinase family enzyme
MATTVRHVRVVAVVNPNATSTAVEIREVVLGSLAGSGSVEVVTTTHRGHAIEAAAAARRRGADAVVAYGGDGTVNEVLNGLLGEGPGPDVPALGIIPGGSANVFARNLGLPRDPVAATGRLLWALRHGPRTRRVGLATADDRWFAFNAGVGLDAAVVAGVERARTRGKKATPARYVRTAVRQFFAEDRHEGPLTLHLPDGTVEPGLFMLLVTNASPWTYLGPVAVRPTPRSSFDAGLDVAGLRRLSVLGTAGQAAAITLTRIGPMGPNAVVLHDLQGFALTATRPVPFQVDGDYLGERTAITITAVPDAIGVLG